MSEHNLMAMGWKIKRLGGACVTSGEPGDRYRHEWERMDFNNYGPGFYVVFIPWEKTVVFHKSTVSDHNDNDLIFLAGMIMGRRKL